jgi:hypothetical protein
MAAKWSKMDRMVAIQKALQLLTSDVNLHMQHIFWEVGAFEVDCRSWNSKLACMVGHHGMP